VSAALAQDKPAPARVPPPSPTSPVVQGSTEVPYPPGANGDAVVLLELTVETDGTVSNATAIDGVEPFAGQARRAVLAWRFLPARRGGTPIAARIRARVDFHQEHPTAVPSTLSPAARVAPGSAPAAPSPLGTAAAHEMPEEVEVRGVRHEIGETTLSASDVREMPGAFGDPFRAIEALPGVAPVVSGLPFFYIRGAPPNDNAYFVDGIRVPLLFHVGIGEGVIHPALIDHVDFYPGAAPAAYGGSVGAVIAGQTRDPAAKPHGEANVRLIDAGALLESPLGDGRASALAAGRYGYPGPIVSAITPTLRLGYWDYQARLTFRVGDRDTVGVFAFGSHDYLGTAQTTNGQVGPITEQLSSDFHRVDLRYDRALDHGHLRIATTLGYDSQGGAGVGDGAATAGVTTITNLSAGLRLEADKRLSHAVRVRGGADVRLDDYGFAQGQGSIDQNGSPQSPLSESADPPPLNISGGAHADVVWRVTPRVEIVPGARVDVFDSSRANGPSGARATTMVPAFDPRLSARVTIAPAVAWLSAFGLSHQYPALRVGAVPAILLSVPGFPRGDSELQTVAQASQGVEVALPADFTLTTTGFLSGWSGLTDLTANCIQIMPATSPPQTGNAPPPQVPFTCPSNQPVQGLAYGVEVLLRRPLSKRLSGWLSYTLSRSTRGEHFITATGGDAAATVVSDYDRTHVLNAILAYDLGLRWRAGARFVFLSGAPYSNLAGNVPAPPYNAYRDPPFYRVDVRLEKRWSLARDGYIAFIAEVENATLSKEVTPFGLSCKGTPTMTQCSHSSIGPLTLPSAGVEASF
jgi:TonB-dependent Receptor Plug Domain/Gram-negative bacterial TonB protein C-terminal